MSRERYGLHFYFGTAQAARQAWRELQRYHLPKGPKSRTVSSCGADAFELYLARPIPQGLTRRSPSSDTPPLYDATFIPYAAGRRIPDAGEYRIELDRVR